MFEKPTRNCKRGTSKTSIGGTTKASLPDYSQRDYSKLNKLLEEREAAKKESLEPMKKKPVPIPKESYKRKRPQKFRVNKSEVMSQRIIDEAIIIAKTLR